MSVPTPAPTRIRARLRDGVTELVFLMPHVMETGLRKNPAGGFVPAHFISEVQVSVEGRSVFAARLTAAVARDPLLTVRFRGARVGERVSVDWIDTQGVRRSDSGAIA
jgi:sulfur-oxidizing protein SoxZ